jgi:hypothetical protein
VVNEATTSKSIPMDTHFAVLPLGTSEISRSANKLVRMS